MLDGWLDGWLNWWWISVAVTVVAGLLLARPIAIHRRRAHAEHDCPKGEMYHLDAAGALTLRAVLARMRSSVKELDRVASPPAASSGEISPRHAVLGYTDRQPMCHRGRGWGGS